MVFCDAYAGDILTLHSIVPVWGGLNQLAAGGGGTHQALYGMYALLLPIPLHSPFPFLPLV